MKLRDHFQGSNKRRMLVVRKVSEEQFTGVQNLTNDGSCHLG